MDILKIALERKSVTESLARDTDRPLADGRFPLLDSLHDAVVVSLQKLSTLRHGGPPGREHFHDSASGGCARRGMGRAERCRQGGERAGTGQTNRHQQRQTQREREIVPMWCGH